MNIDAKMDSILQFVKDSSHNKSCCLQSLPKLVVLDNSYGRTVYIPEHTLDLVLVFHSNSILS